MHGAVRFHIMLARCFSSNWLHASAASLSSSLLQGTEGHGTEGREESEFVTPRGGNELRAHGASLSLGGHLMRDEEGDVNDTPSRLERSMDTC